MSVGVPAGLAVSTHNLYSKGAWDTKTGTKAEEIMTPRDNTLQATKGRGPRDPQKATNTVQTRNMSSIL